MSDDVLPCAKAPAWNQRVTSEQVVAAYMATGSVWRAAKQLGISGQGVHQRLVNLGHQIPNCAWTQDEDDELATLIANRVALSEIANRLGRPYAGVAARASRRGLKSDRGPRTRKIPRGAGLDKISVGKHLRALEQSGIKVTQYARREGLQIELLAQALEKHYPDRWNEYKRTHSQLPTKTCPYCEQQFIPGSGKQIYCTRECGTAARKDRDYFGGNRRDAIGLAEGVCQLCGRSEVKGLSAHHIVGKENDPNDAGLIALCRGCHRIVTILGGRSFVGDTATWEALISLAWARHHGGRMMENPGRGISVSVHIDEWEQEDDEEYNEHLLLKGQQ